MKLTKGVILKARGGWDAEVIWIRVDKQGFYAVHRPGILGSGSSVRIGNLSFQSTNGESCPVYHWPNGTARAAFTIGEPPVYTGHPADLEMEEYEL